MNRMTDLKPGKARCPGVSVQDLLRDDSRQAPGYLTTESYEFLGDQVIPFERYISPDYFQQELKLGVAAALVGGPGTVDLLLKAYAAFN